MKLLSIVLLAILVSFGAVSAQSRSEKKRANKEKAVKEYLLMKEVVEKGKMKITMDRASGQRGLTVQLTSTYLLTIDGNEGATELPFYGTSQGGGLNADTGITFNGELIDYVADFNDKKQKVVIEFKAKTPSNDTLRFTVKIKSWSASISVISNSKSSMSYDGRLEAL